MHMFTPNSKHCINDSSGPWPTMNMYSCIPVYWTASTPISTRTPARSGGSSVLSQWRASHPDMCRASYSSSDFFLISPVSHVPGFYALWKHGCASVLTECIQTDNSHWLNSVPFQQLAHVWSFQLSQKFLHHAGEWLTIGNLHFEPASAKSWAHFHHTTLISTL
jgi:hypothetical protein